MCPTTFTKALSPLLTLAASLPSLTAVDEPSSFRIVPQILVGTSGVEPGLAAELYVPEWRIAALRPELFISEDGDLGGGVSALWLLARLRELSSRHDFAIGPRVIHHNSDEHGIEGGVLGIWNIALGDLLNQRHSIEILASVGIADDRDDGDGADLAFSAGAAYAYRF